MTKQWVIIDRDRLVDQIETSSEDIAVFDLDFLSLDSNELEDSGYDKPWLEDFVKRMREYNAPADTIKQVEDFIKAVWP